MRNFVKLTASELGSDEHPMAIRFHIHFARAARHPMRLTASDSLPGDLLEEARFRKSWFKLVLVMKSNFLLLQFKPFTTIL